ncbi:Cobalamin-binding protein [Georgfuchsia toluolica]|uniref:Cobalamin-binding protein n=1 Tax=Georgfuchsia toluolica TaxID=424218 RepID=A0A916J4Z2_9PROT|nr:cobalamin-binding protein [Georgfuchsia toluolica]CAG4884088.1 Cobalamin-binding protein [Georgfuchsia toluolica]
MAFFRSFLIAAALLSLSTGAHADIVVKDDSGAEVHLRQPAQRVIALSPHIAETLMAAGAGERLVGSVQFSDYPAAVKKVPRIGSYARLDMEAIVALKPDLVIGWQSGNTPAHIEKIRQLGIPVYLSQPNRIEDVAHDLESYGQLMGNEAGARAAAAFRARLAALRERYSNQPRLRIFYQVWKEPLMTVGNTQIISDAIRLCGGENVFGQLRQMAPTVTVEAVLAANPEVIVASGMDEARPEWLDDWRRWPQLTAVARDNLYFIPPDIIQRHTPRLLDGTEMLCRHLETARGKRPSAKGDGK